MKETSTSTIPIGITLTQPIGVTGTITPNIEVGPLKGMPKIAQHLEPENVPGGRISISHDLIDGEHFVIIREQGGKEILKVQKSLWDDSIAGFSADIRDSIMTCVRMLYG